MDFLRCSETILQYFHLLGLSSFNSIYISKTRSSASFLANIFIIIQAVFSFVLSISCAIQMCMVAIQQPHSRTNIILTTFFAFSQIGRSFCTFTQCLRSKALMFEIIQQFRRIESYFYIHLNHRVPYTKFHRAYTSKVILVLIAYIHFLALTVMVSIVHARQPTVVFEVRFLEGISVLALLHASYFIDAIDFHFGQLIQVVGRDFSSFAHDADHPYGQNRNLRNRLINYKTLHFRLWEVTQQINAYFAWYLVFMFLHFFDAFVYSTYWLISSVSHSTGPLNVLFVYCKPSNFRIRSAKDL